MSILPTSVAKVYVAIYTRHIVGLSMKEATLVLNTHIFSTWARFAIFTWFSLWK